MKVLIMTTGSSMKSFLIPEELYYTKSHEWLQIDENLVTLGLTEAALKDLGEILYFDLPEDGQKVTPGQVVGSVESVLKIHDLASSINGTVLEVNSSLFDDPHVINDDPLGEGWLLRVELDNERDLAPLMRAKEYKEYLASSESAT